MLTEGLVSPVRVETGSLRAAIEALQACADDLLTVWGLDAEKHKTMTAPPIMNPNPDGVLPQGTVPFSEFGKFSGGANQVRLLIGADGKVTACAIQRRRCRSRSTKDLQPGQGAGVVPAGQGCRRAGRWPACGWARRCSSARRPGGRAGAGGR